MHQTILSNLIW